MGSPASDTMAIARVLVIEDEEDIASFIKRGLVLKGYDVDVASTGSEGLNVFRDRPACPLNLPAGRSDHEIADLDRL